MIHKTSQAPENEELQPVGTSSETINIRGVGCQLGRGGLKNARSKAGGEFFFLFGLRAGGFDFLSRLGCG